MLKLREVRGKNGAIEHIETGYTGHNLLNAPKLNKGNAFSMEERQELGLLGALPEHIETLEEQASHLYQQYPKKPHTYKRTFFKWHYRVLQGGTRPLKKNVPGYLHTNGWRCR